MISLTIGLGSVISSTVGGFISDTYGVGSMNMFALIITIISVIGFIITILVKQRSTVS